MMAWKILTFVRTRTLRALKYRRSISVVESGGRDADPFSHCRVVTTTFRHHAPKVFELHDTLDGRAVNGGGGGWRLNGGNVCVYAL